MGLTKAEREARAFLQTFDAKPLQAARKRLEAHTDGRKHKPKRTPEQKRAQTEAARAKVRANRGVTISLKCSHWVDGINYGPGVVTVDPDLAKCLLENERRVEYNNQRFDGSQAAFIGPQGRAIPVPAAVMDSPMLNVLEAFMIT